MYGDHNLGFACRYLFFFIVLFASGSFGNQLLSVPCWLSEEESFYTHRFDFSKSYPDMENMEIQAQRKKRVEFNLTGEFPKLETLNYQGSFGHLRAKCRGVYPVLYALNFSCSSCKMDMDFRGKWNRSSTITISNQKESINLKLPKDVGVIVNTKTSLKGNVCPGSTFIKQGWGVWNKIYHNDLVGFSEVTLIFNVSSEGGTITFS
ncbi:Uncharacterized protein BN1224_CV14_A_06130 [Chlamydia pneumoniae]|uniref:Uncharacterized protein n=1 Tax=Chlamydia pneumoniae TaxID=83558 RepID=A0A0F7WM02_CHLPN|nr:Uncharacterized protein BN1224_Wien1_A_06110 [Chlamydia pneumoniae]CRI37094.1 Uncharacterized protein BN1224_CV14_A_06130 [Chlamydia pneumoniae]CRI38222.1 Uncharacterized protein BN1224_CV15_C_00550 [Chlamydia pneumoniae]CRI39354.1 Uncharacterized protein BN1224_CWL011_A_06180 [Chlamydia pneumoniae]CRI43842.1 Uncharacterized protein BN1224_H12_EJ_00200 [Chlamydia pneumoniae]